MGATPCLNAASQKRTVEELPRLCQVEVQGGNEHRSAPVTCRYRQMIERAEWRWS